jgi:hypothetical protein
VLEHRHLELTQGWHPAACARHLPNGSPTRLRPSIGLSADGITFEEAAANGDSFELEGRRVPVIGLDALLKNKRAVAREQDIAAIVALEAIRRGG